MQNFGGMPSPRRRNTSKQPTPPLPPSRRGSSTTAPPSQLGRSRAGSSMDRFVAEEEDSDDASSVDSTQSFQSLISTPYFDSLERRGGSSINLTLVYDELYKNDRRRETLREIVEFHDSRRKLKRGASKSNALLAQAAHASASLKQSAQIAKLLNGSPTKGENAATATLMRRIPSAKDLYGNPISPRFSTMTKWSSVGSRLDELSLDDKNVATMEPTAGLRTTTAPLQLPLIPPPVVINADTAPNSVARLAKLFNRGAAPAVSAARPLSVRTRSVSGSAVPLTDGLLSPKGVVAAARDRLLSPRCEVSPFSLDDDQSSVASSAINASMAAAQPGPTAGGGGRIGPGSEYTVSEDDIGYSSRIHGGSVLRKMSSTTSDIVRKIKRQQKFLRSSRSDVRTVRLPRGGVVVNTRIGAIQVGLPPETIKDSMNMGLSIPTIFVIPQQRFHRWRMISVAEFEFPAYFNFFVLKRAVRLVTTKSAEVALRAAFQESLLGPVDLSMESIADDFDPNLPKSMRPNINAERMFFGKNNIDSLIEFVTLKEVRNKSYLEADLGDDIFVRLEAGEGEDSYVVLDRRQVEEEDADRQARSEGSETDGEKGSKSGSKSPTQRPKRRHRRASSDITEFPSAPTRTHKRRGSTLGQDYPFTFNGGEILARVPDSVELPNFRTFGLLDIRPEPFVPPSFGVTFLGTSHGFDPKSSTTGFVVWINGVGMLVDPPPNSGPMLELMGIPPRIIRNVLVTHCHADHDAGTMQKIMLDENVTVVTTPTIMNSFLRKYSAISGISIADIRKRFIFRSARVGQWMDLFGGEIRVFYAFHTIPCVGFEVKFGGKSIVYSADTFYEPTMIMDLCKQGILSDERAKALVEFPWDADLILHECGVPPIHTPLKCLADLSEDVKSRLYLVHVTKASVTPGLGLKVAVEGVENTLVLDTMYSVPPLASAITVVGWIRDAAPLRDMSIGQLMDLLTVMRLCDFREGEMVTEEILNDSFVIIGSGAALMYPPGKTTGDGTRTMFQGESSLLLQGDCVFVGGPTHENTEDRPILVASSQTLRCAIFQVADVDCFAREGNETYNVVMKWRRESQLRDQFSDIGVVDCLTLRQRALFSSLFTEQRFKRGDKLWSHGKPCEFVYVLTGGTYEIAFHGHKVQEAESNKTASAPPQPLIRSMSTSVVNLDTSVASLSASFDHSDALVVGRPMLKSIGRFASTSNLPQVTAAPRKTATYDTQQFKEATQQFSNLQFNLKEFHKGKAVKILACDLPALYHDLPVTSDLTVTSVRGKVYMAPAAAMLSFLRTTPHFLFRMHADFISNVVKGDLGEDY